MQQRRPLSSDTLTLLAYLALLVYGTLYSSQAWVHPGVSPFRMMWQAGFEHTSRADMLTNLVVYFPLGFLLMRVMPVARRCRGCGWLLTVLAGALFSLVLEYLQGYIPGRTPSVLDLLLNTIGTGIGALLALAFRPGGSLARHLRHLRQVYVVPGAGADIGLLAIGLWALAQLTPLVPSLDLDNLRQGLKPLHRFLLHPGTFSWSHFWEYATSIGALGLLYASIQRFRYRALPRFLAFVLAVLAAKVLVVSRQLSGEALLALLTAALTLPLLLRLKGSTRLAVAALLIVVGRILTALRPGNATDILHPFNWIPFSGHMTNNLIGMMDIVADIWPFVALAGLGMLWIQDRKWRGVMLYGALLVFLGTFLLEWLQLRIPGRSADVTDVLLATLAWCLPWFHYAKWAEPPSAPADGAPAPFPLRWWVIATLILLLGGGTWALVVPKPAPSPHPHRLPEASELPPASIPGFRHRHPRLPSPSPREMAYLAKHNPGYLKSHLKRAQGGKGPFESVIISAYFKPGSQNLDLLFQRLMALKPSWRGHQQAKPLAMAYDWLYAQWTPEQRRKLARKVVEASDYIIDYIREQALSPYNVYLYNSSLQALVAAAIAAYGDINDADPPMRWTKAFLEERVLPVWRQVMGEHGGWHEGGEYVGIGIGQAIYEIPAMWRKATGQDLFLSEPGIPGFADFLIYRTRPDGTSMRWGDAAYFDNAVPNRVPLALETGNKAAYSLHCPKPDRPSAWPWGPLTRKSFCDKQALQQLPLQKLFDGMGLLVARSDWSKDATYVTFKAGDNFWSHSHLDQGAFTIYKEGPLAIDSGLYGPSYGSGHHLNYTYQTIAHNVITVTDPKDVVPMPPKKREQKPRPIANDGGQRRVGSGWGLPAPMDLKEWQEQREIYHTGRIARYYSGHDLVVAVAELTPAYTNRESGHGTFAHRTFRVNKYWRTFLYDRKEDLIIVYDDVTAADPTFRKRSLVHTLEKPTLTTTGFTIDTPARRKPLAPSRKPGHMEVFVLFPRHARIELVGGPGKDFWVDGKNYDANGKIWKIVARRKHNPPEPGKWRVEISPPAPHRRDRFLMVMAPGRHELPPLLEPIENANGIGVRILGKDRTLELLYPNDRDGITILIDQAGHKEKLDLTLPAAEPLQPDDDIWTRLTQWLGVAS